MQVITAMFVGLVNVVLIARCQPYCGHAREEGDLEDAKKNVGVGNSFAMQSVLMGFLSLSSARCSASLTAGLLQQARWRRDIATKCCSGSC